MNTTNPYQNYQFQLPYKATNLAQNVTLPAMGQGMSAFDTMKAYNTSQMPTLDPNLDYSAAANFNLGTSPSSWSFGGALSGINDWLGSDSAKNLGSFLGPVASLGSAYLSYSAGQDALDEQRRQNDFLQKFATTQLNNEVALQQNRAADINAMRNFSIAGNSDAVTPEQLSSWGQEGKDRQGLQKL